MSTVINCLKNMLYYIPPKEKIHDNKFFIKSRSYIQAGANQ